MIRLRTEYELRAELEENLQAAYKDIDYWRAEAEKRITLRQKAAMMAMQGILGNPSIDEGCISVMAKSAVSIADALIAELERTEK